MQQTHAPVKRSSGKVVHVFTVQIWTGTSGVRFECITIDPLQCLEVHIEHMQTI